MSQSAIQYILDQKGNHTGVIVPIKRRDSPASWKSIESELETAYLLKSEIMKRRLLVAKT